MLNSLSIRHLLVCLLGLLGLISTSCRGHSAESSIGPVEPIRLRAHERVYEGFIISGAKGEAFVREVGGLRRPGQLNWVEYDPATFKAKQTWRDIRRVGERINWPSRENRSRIIRIKFIGREKEIPLRLASLAELGKELIIERVIGYSNELRAEELSEWQ